MKINQRKLAALAFAVGASVAGSAALAHGPPARNATPPSLYVADAKHSVVIRFGLKRDIPIVPAAGTLQVAYTPWHIAVGPPGMLFVAYLSPTQVDVFDSSAIGKAKPLRRLMLNASPSGIAVDTAGYLYVSGLQPGAVDIYAPGAHGHAAPIAQVVAPLNSPTTLVTLDPGGRLFFANTASGAPALLEYANPLKTPLNVRTLYFPFGARIFGAALDVLHELYLIQSTSATVIAYSPSACCSNYLPDRTIVPLGQPFAPLGIAVRNRHAFVISNAPSQQVPATIYTFDIFEGSQTPLSVTSGAPLAAPVAIAVDQ